MRRVPFASAALALAGLVPLGAAAFNPDPRPAPGIDAVCADDTTVLCCNNQDENQSCDAPQISFRDCGSKTCVGDPADLPSAVEVRGTITLVADEDVTGWDGPEPGYLRVPANARLTLLLQYERNGTLRTFAEIYQLDDQGCVVDIDEPFLCLPGFLWNQPASEATITDPRLHVVFTVLGGAVGKAVAVELTGDANTTLRPYIDIADRLPATSSDHSGSDAVASVQQLKVTIRLAPAAP